MILYIHDLGLDRPSVLHKSLFKLLDLNLFWLPTMEKHKIWSAYADGDKMYQREWTKNPMKAQFSTSRTRIGRWTEGCYYGKL